jgi:hypothetical protein
VVVGSKCVSRASEKYVAFPAPGGFVASRDFDPHLKEVVSLHARALAREWEPCQLSL